MLAHGDDVAEASGKVSDLDGHEPEANDYANYFCAYAYIYHQVISPALFGYARMSTTLARLSRLQAPGAPHGDTPALHAARSRVLDSPPADFQANTDALPAFNSIIACSCQSALNHMAHTLEVVCWTEPCRVSVAVLSGTLDTTNSCGWPFVQKDMLEDHKRTGAYHQAILNNRACFEGKVVLDVGTGSGILAIFAAQAGARRVYAVEATNMAKLARQLVEHNNVRRCVQTTWPQSRQCSAAAAFRS